jgi:GDP/UDP-N,N'-diacetylbacillosamine 2-epimerase (hydrolysing)
MKIGVLTSSRADYGIYLPLLNKLLEDRFFNLEIIAFGAHLSKSNGFTVEEIEQTNFSKIHKISTLLSNDDECSIATSYGLTIIKFADFWSKNKFDLVFCLGDRFEMSAAVQAGIPFSIKYAHLHGGETTLGAIDNIYRHQITHASNLHFTATEKFYQRVSELKGDTSNIYTVGSLSLDSIDNFVPIEKNTFYNEFKINQDNFALITFHPETIAKEKNEVFAVEMKKALSEISSKLFLVITMPNADTMGSLFRDKISQLKQENPDKIVCIENFGKENYFNAMHYSKMLIGNTSSGIIEAASFEKYVINVGNRQEGRSQSRNIINTLFKKEAIIDAVEEILKFNKFNGENVYYKRGAASKIINILKSHYERI